MELLVYKGEEYIKISRSVYRDNRGKSDLDQLKNWMQPLRFRNNSEVLCQYNSGPCGLFAVLQAHIVLKRNDDLTVEAEKEHILISLILDIFTRISSHYIFCESYDTSKKEITFRITDSLDAAYSYLLETMYTDSQNACLMLTISIVLASIGIHELKEPDNPYIEFDKMSTMALVWLILNGSTSNENINQTESANYEGIAQNRIGIKVLSSPDKRVIGTWLNPNANIFVCYRGFHFFVVYCLADNYIVYDSLNSQSPFESTKKALNWPD